MHPGHLSTTIAIAAPAHEKVIPASVSSVPSLRDESWIAAALHKPWQFALKRAIDITLSASAILVLLPFALAVAAAIVIENRGPVLFTQLRWGKGGKLIRIYKFRSMRTDMCDITGVAQTKENDPRVTRVGAFLRKTNLDELPQLINILKGDMSLVGPRCHVPGMLAAGLPYEQLVEDYHLRHLVRPGLTGLAQVRGLRGPTDREDVSRARVAADIEYIKTFSVMNDLKILFKTAINEIRGGTGF